MIPIVQEEKHILDNNDKLESLIVDICKIIHDANKGNYQMENKPFVPWEELDASMKNDIRNSVINNLFVESISDKIKKAIMDGKVK